MSAIPSWTMSGAGRNKPAWPSTSYLQWLELSTGKYYEWCQRYGLVNQHNGKVPRGFWLKDIEKNTLLHYQELYPQDGYRRLTYMMMDANVAAVSPSSVFRVLRVAGRLRR